MTVRAMALLFSLILILALAGCDGNSKPAETTIPDVSQVTTLDPDALNKFISLVDYGKLLVTVRHLTQADHEVKENMGE